MIKGSCNCRKISFEVTGPVRSTSYCHCGQCRRQAGNFWAAAVTEDSDIRISGPVTWYASSDFAKRGFCATCGSFLFWKHNAESSISFGLGTLDAGSGLKIEKHIFVADKGDYYDIADDLPQHDT
ncbi:GFA family protein [Roseobacter sp.]|uniref:GFA family protein n=1 Tax=Roseobacter sp. TaxID=1907202 RepID=UPI0025F43F6F|nr:GFA family protein [Roseobacter sp.]